MSRKGLVRVTWLMMVLMSVTAVAPTRSEAGVVALAGVVVEAVGEPSPGFDSGGGGLLLIAAGVLIGTGAFAAGSSFDPRWLRYFTIALPADAVAAATALQRALPFLAYADAEEFTARVRTKVDAKQFEPIVVQGKSQAFVRFSRQEVEEVLGHGDYSSDRIALAVEALR